VINVFTEVLGFSRVDRAIGSACTSMPGQANSHLPPLRPLERYGAPRFGEAS
jgi:hypothetical protein